MCKSWRTRAYRGFSCDDLMRKFAFTDSIPLSELHVRIIRKKKKAHGKVVVQKRYIKNQEK